jgi:hypothetical protein
MKQLKHNLWVLAVSVNSIFVAATAQALPTNSDLNTTVVTMPDNLCSGYEFTFAALGLQPGATNLNYVINNKNLPAQSPTWREQELQPTYSFGFMLAGSYLFPHGRDITLDWTHLYNNTSANLNAASASYFLGPDFEIGPFGLTDRNATGSATFKYDVINLSAGQKVNFGSHVQMRFFGGLSNVYLREQVNANYYGVQSGVLSGPFYTKPQVTANYYGIGPRAGADAMFECDNGWGIFGEMAASALIGYSYAKTNFISSAPFLLAVYNQTVNNQFISDQNVKQVIPALDGKLGVSYKHDFMKGTKLKVAAGYQAAVYVNALNEYLPETLVPGISTETGGIFVQTMKQRLSNYSVQGPFLSVTVTG